TRSSRGRSSVASAFRATKMNRGAPNGAAASRRADAGRATPTSMRPRTRSPPIDPLTAISAVRVFTRWQAAVASTMASRARGAGAPGPEGSFSSGAPQPVLIIATANTPRTPRTPQNHETESVLYKAFFVRFVLSRVSGLPLVQPLLRRFDLPVDVP